MDKFVFIGCEKKKSQTGNEYYMLHYGREIESKNGTGVKPISSKIDKDEFEEFSSLAIGIEFMASYEATELKTGGWKYTLRRYKL